MLWVDKYRPTKLEQLSYHPDITSRLWSISENPQSMPHLFVYGPSGSGKKTRINSLLRQLYGSGIEKLKLDQRTFTTPTRRVVDVHMITSNYHIELSPGDAGLNDKYVVQEIIKEMAANKNIMSNIMTTTSTNAADDDGGGKKLPAVSKPNKPQFKTVVLTDVDKLSRQAQAGLRRTMEKYSTTCRLILVCESSSKVMDPVKSRCLGIRIPSPTHDEICTVLKFVSSKQSLTLPDELAISIARASSRNLRRALLMLESAYVQNRDGFKKDLDIPKTDWELYIAKLAVEITKEQTPQRLGAAREKMYELLVNCIPASVIIKTLTNELIKNLDDDIKKQVVYWAAFYEHRIALGSKEIFHLEAFVAKYMSIYKRYLNELFG